jgi:hypothetical protein
MFEGVAVIAPTGQAPLRHQSPVSFSNFHHGIQRMLRQRGLYVYTNFRT